MPNSDFAILTLAVCILQFASPTPASRVCQESFIASPELRAILHLDICILHFDLAGFASLPWYTAHMDSKKALKAVGARIRKLREAKGVSQEEAARLAGIDRSYYGRIERGVINVSAVFLLKIGRMLHCPVGSFFPPA
jgi:DNA-binding XRE family transcriptional regulator